MKRRNEKHFDEVMSITNQKIIIQISGTRVESSVLGVCLAHIGDWGQTSVSKLTFIWRFSRSMKEGRSDTWYIFKKSDGTEEAAKARGPLASYLREQP